MEVMAHTGNGTISSKRLISVNIGALFTFNSAIGRSAKPAILAAVDEVSSDSSVLKGTKLNIIFHDTNCSGFLRTVEDVVSSCLNTTVDICFLTKKRSKIAYKAAFTPGAPLSDINDLLVGVNLMEYRVYIVHVNPESGLSIFSVAKDLGMMNSGYVWIATDWLPTHIDSLVPPDPDTTII